MSRSFEIMIQMETKEDDAWVKGQSVDTRPVRSSLEAALDHEDLQRRHAAGSGRVSSSAPSFIPDTPMFFLLLPSCHGDPRAFLVSLWSINSSEGRWVT